MKVIYNDCVRRKDEEADLNVTYAGFDDLLASADFVLVMAPLTPENRGMFGAAQFARMKPSAYFVNSARGELVDTNALYDALRHGRSLTPRSMSSIPSRCRQATRPLTLPNLLITPHIGTANHETRDAMTSGSREPAGGTGRGSRCQPVSIRR